MSTKGSIVVARLTAIRDTGARMIIEVHADANFQKFFHYFTQNGLKRSTKKQIRISNRNDGLPCVNAHLHRPGLEALQRRLEATKQFKSVKVRIIRKRAYKQLINAAPAGLPRAGSLGLRHVGPTIRVLPALRSPKAIPVDKWLANLKLNQVTQ